MSSNARPVTYAVYKGKGAIQFNLKPAQLPREPVEGKIPVLEEGKIFVEAANATGSRQYDWSKKATIALGVNDIGKILQGFKDGEANLIHAKYAGTERAKEHFSSLKISKGQDGKSFLWSFTIKNQTEPEKNTNVSVFTDLAETRVINNLFEGAIEKLLGW